jgi:sterol desaturase/sphingolipid hydroxylase (fatty acid hydroxylase superfamily)
MEIVSGWSDTAIRLTLSGLVFVTLAAIELAAPWRDVHFRQRRWFANAGVFVVDVIAVRILAPFSLVALASQWTAQGFGLFPMLGLTGLLGGIIAFILLDCLIYWQHRIFHRIPVLWRLHRMHHTDTELDVTSAFRFHPVEILLSIGVKALAILVLGPPALAVLVFEILLNATAQFNHANLRIPPRIEGLLRWFIVTPEMHVIHHSTRQRETDSNFGFNLPIWDRIFGSYTHAPEGGYAAMTIGLETFRDPSEQRTDKLVTQPFRDAERSYDSP